MKKFYIKIFFTFILLLICRCSYAQNWKPVHQDWRFNYKLNFAGHITHTAWIDSTGIVNGDSVFYMNRIFTHCDSCTAALGGTNPCDSCYGLRNQPQFLMRTAIQLPNGIYNFRDTNNIVLNSLAALNDTWLFDSIYNVSAQITDVSVKNIFGNNDSVKTILLSTGDTILLSKNYGILQYPQQYNQNIYYRLTGIEGPDLGEQVPGFWQIFDFNVGDVFHYDGYFVDGSATPPYWIDYDKQYTITAKNIYNDSVSYNYQGSIWGFNVVAGYFSSPLNSNITLHDSAEHFSNLFNKELIETKSRLMYNFFEPFLFDSVYDFVQFSLDSNVIFTKSFGNDNFSFNNFILVNPTNDLLNTVDIFTTNWWLGSSFLKYKTGLGQTDYGYGYFEHAGSEHLVGYVKNGDTVGVISGMNPVIDSFPFFSVYPNPASDLVNVHFIDAAAGIVFLTDITGKKLFEKNFDSKYLQIDTRNFSSGMYILNVQSKKINVKRKIVISKE